MPHFLSRGIFFSNDLGTNGSRWCLVIKVISVELFSRAFFIITQSLHFTPIINSSSGLAMEIIMTCVWTKTKEKRRNKIEKNYVNTPFLTWLAPLYQNECPCETIHKKMDSSLYKTKSMRALWMANQLWFIVTVDSWKNCTRFTLRPFFMQIKLVLIWYEIFSWRPRFETESQKNSEMAYSHRFLRFHFSSKVVRVWYITLWSVYYSVFLNHFEGLKTINWSETHVLWTLRFAFFYVWICKLIWVEILRLCTCVSEDFAV